MKMKIKKRSSVEWLFLTILFIYTVSRLIRFSTLNDVLPVFLYNVSKLAVLLGSLLTIALNMKYSKKYITTIYIIVVFLLAMFTFNDYFVDIACVMLLVLASAVTDFRSILKCISSALIFSTVLIVSLCVLHVLPDYTYRHKVLEVVMNAHAYGFNYYSSPAYITMSLTAIYLYLHDNISYFRLGTIAFINCVAFLFHTTQLAIIISILLIAVYVLTRKIKVLHFNNKFWKYFSLIFPLTLCLLTILLVKLYEKNMLSLPGYFSTLESRLIYSVQALNKYKISLFGSYIEGYGNVRSVYGNVTSSFFVDSGFLYALIAYGIIFTILIILIYTLIYRFLVSDDDGFLFAWMSLMLVASIVNNFLMNCHYNPLIFLLPYAIKDGFGHKNRKIV